MKKFQKDPRTEILGYKTFKGPCTLRACFLSWGNVLFSGLSSFSPLAVYFSPHLFLHSSEGSEICCDADVSSHNRGLVRRGKSLGKRKCLLKNIDREKPASLGTRHALEKHS